MAKKRKKPMLSRKMRTKLMVLFSFIVLALVALIGRLMYINYTSGDKYEKKVLSLQSYDSVTIPYQRGDIVDRTGTVLATSVAVYNVILDCSVTTSKDLYVQPTLDALMTCFPELDRATLEGYVTNDKTNRYIVLLKKLPYEQIESFVEMQNALNEDGEKLNPYIKGVWFEKEYQRYYPYGTLASSVIGFSSAGNVGTIGLENYYNDELNGVNGREYGYLNSDNNFERTVIDAEDGNTIVCSIDANLQSIVESKIVEFNEAYRDNYYFGPGSKNTAVIAMNPNNGEILAMANYPSFDLNNPRDLSGVMTQEEIEGLSDEETMDALNALWQNFCITYTYEPGSVQKPYTVACGLETGTVTTDMTFFCDGHETFDGNVWVNCHKVEGHGMETVEGAVMDSCNDALMQMSYKIGAENFLKYQDIFNFGLKTGIDLPGEPNTSGLVYTLDKMKPVDLATNSFGQNYNCTMIQMASAFCSLINGGTYYQPHLVTKITDYDGNTISLQPGVAVKQTISESTSETIKGYLYNTVTSGGAMLAKVDGYSMGGKTGTAEKQPRELNNYLVSFVGFAPVDNPQIVIYVVVDEPNCLDQDHSSFAMAIAREILEEALPYLNIYPDEEFTGANADLDVTNGNYLINEVKNPIPKPTLEEVLQRLEEEQQNSEEPQTPEEPQTLEEPQTPEEQQNPEEQTP